jgi:hypothetical protein
MLGHRAWDTKYIQTLDPPHDEYYMDQAFREFIGDEYARMLEYIRRFAIATINIPNQMFTPETNSISEWYRRPYDMRKAPSEPDVISVDKITTDFVERRIIHYAITEDNPSYIVCQFFDQHPCDARSADGIYSSYGNPPIHARHKKTSA